MMTIDITSLSNPKIKWLRSLHSNSTRRKEGVFLVEGAKEITMALDGGYQPTSFFMCPEISGDGMPTESAQEMYTISRHYFPRAS